MNSIYSAIESLTEALKQLTPVNLRIEMLEAIEKKLASVDVHELLDAYRESLPAPPATPEESMAYRKTMQEEADRLNRAITPLRESVEEIKKLRRTLNLEALDPIILQSRQIVRVLYDLSASLNG